MSTYSNMLDLLILYRSRGLRYEYVRGVHLPVGELPMSAFRGPEIGGDACHMRMWELRAPVGHRPSAKGIPIRKARRRYAGNDGQTHHVITYTLDIHPDLIEDLIDRSGPSLRKDIAEQLGFEVEDFLDDADGEDKPGKTVRLVKSQTKLPLAAA